MLKCEQSNVWIVDSDASNLMTRDIKLLTKFDPYYENWTIKITDGSLSRVVGTGSMTFYVNFKTWI